MRLMKTMLASALVLGTAFAAKAQSGTTVKHVQTDASFLAAGVWAGDTYYMSGTMASPVSGTGATAEYGDTKAQTASILTKIQTGLKAQGLDMKDVVKCTVFLAADPKLGKIDFAGMNSEFVKYFGTKEQPNKPARSAVQVANLVAPWALLEIEVIAVKSK